MSIQHSQTTTLASCGCSSADRAVFRRRTGREFESHRSHIYGITPASSAGVISFKAGNIWQGSPNPLFLRQNVGVFVRYRSVEPNTRGLKVGIFALTNGLLSDGVLTPAEVEWVRENNYWYENNYIDPAKVDQRVFDRLINPGTEC